MSQMTMTLDDSLLAQVQDVLGVSSKVEAVRCALQEVAQRAREQRRPVGEQGLVDWLRACPEPGFFVPIESESTDTL